MKKNSQKNSVSCRLCDRCGEPSIKFKDGKRTGPIKSHFGDFVWCLPCFRRFRNMGP